MNETIPQDLRKILGQFLTGVTVVTTLDQDGMPVGFTANSFTSVSLDPPLILVCLSRSTGLAQIFGTVASFAVNILSKEQESISNSFASTKEDRFSEVAWQAKSTGSPIIGGSTAWLDCEIYDRLTAGDHIILLGRVVEAQMSDIEPLGYFQGDYCTVERSGGDSKPKEQDQLIDSAPGLLFDEDDPFASLSKLEHGRKARLD